MVSFYNLLLIVVLVVNFMLAGSDGSCDDIIKKKNWGGRAASEIIYSVIPVKYVIIHHTVTEECSTKESCENVIKSIQNYHIDESDYGDISYNFLIGGDGRIYEGRGWHKVGTHTYGYNSKSVGIAFIGDYRDKNPTENQIAAAKNLLKCGLDSGELSADYKLLGGKQVISTLSPGKRLYDEIKKWEHFSENP